MSGTLPVGRTARAVAAALVVAAVAVTTAGCTTTGSDRPLVAVTTNILGDVVTEVVGDDVDVMVLMPPGGDPHSFEVSAQQAARLRSADLVVENGLGLEEGVAHHVRAAADDGVAVFTAGDAIDALEWTTDDDGGPDPHFWTDPARMVDVIEALDEELDAVGIDTPGAEAYTDRLDALDDDMTAAFDTIPADRKALVTNHHVFGYLADRYGFRVVGAVIPSGTTLASPSAADLRDLANAIEQAGVPTIFADASQPARLAEVLADEVDLQVSIRSLATESLTEDGAASTYLGMMHSNTESIVDGLTAPIS
ncbi:MULTISPECIES: metal ABC transporter substrate-binding protein [unclassified Curtobacterium]|uniref:metal ABC transporter substrate-binding protein n=1 Tax=unclassified Curtobacterium TaxID=257496 RepID=UPI000FB10463|nr:MULTISPECIES: metal ABC transporter substrate-binding protein [unclassified Curtobacterium]ROQ16737.1 zinc/manganese transport system substrate-binding protein [Curtobacterium sp. PhB171]ROQ25187.1 zinc/manganese transport system substrate-binding protein [Curtobacterium sp. PhB170]ROS36638.1 zinc/manganese transport system substrate-binding protein [Curtobacterium sp. PhB131]ROS71315.1 zinc/manganese transport system substrate-binding protein [Curtobacterium sp. PhB141]